MSAFWQQTAAGGEINVRAWSITCQSLTNTRAVPSTKKNGRSALFAALGTSVNVACARLSSSPGGKRPRCPLVWHRTVYCCVMVHVDDVMFCGDGWYWENVFLKKFKEHYNISHSQLQGVGSEITFLKGKSKDWNQACAFSQVQKLQRLLTCLRRTLEKSDPKQLLVTPRSKQRMSVKKCINVMPMPSVL